MDRPCPLTHFFLRSGGLCVVCMIPVCPRYGLPVGTGKAAETEEAEMASKQQKAANDLYREATQMAATHPAQHGTLPERLRALNEEVKKIPGSQSSAYLTGVPHIQPLTQWPGFARERDDWYRGRDLEHDRPAVWQPNAVPYSEFPLLQPNTVPHNTNQMLPDFPSPFVLEQSTMGNSQADTFTDFAPAKNLPTSRDLPLASGKDASNTGENDRSSSEISSNESEFKFTPEHTPEQEEVDAICVPTEASKAQVQPNSPHHNLSNAAGKPVYQFAPFRNVPRIINEGISAEVQRWLEVSNLPGHSGPARPESSATQDKHRRVPRPERNDYTINSSGYGRVRRDCMTFATGELKNKIEKVARYVARSGPKFEEVVRSKNQGTDIVAFLEPTNTYHTYYKWRVEQCKAGNTYDLESEEVSAETDSWSEHINSNGRQHWYNKVSHEFVWDRPLALVAQFQPRKEIGQGIEKRELDFLGDCVKFLPSAVRSKAIAVVDKLQNIAYGALSDETPAEKEDKTIEKLQEVEAALKLIESKHADTESALLKRIEELENKQTPQMPEATAARLNTLYDKLGHIVDQGVQQLDSGQKFDKDQETIVSKLQQRIEALEDKQASQKSDDTADRLERFKREVLETHSALLKNIQGVDGDMHSRTSELAATQDRICEEVREVIDGQVKSFREERTSIADEHKEIMSAILKRTEVLENKQSSEIPGLVASQLSALYDKLENANERLSKFDAGLKLVEDKHKQSESVLLKRIEELENKQTIHASDASSSQSKDAVAGQTVLRAQTAKLEDDPEKRADDESFVNRSSVRMQLDDEADAPFCSPGSLDLDRVPAWARSSEDIVQAARDLVEEGTIQAGHHLTISEATQEATKEAVARIQDRMHRILTQAKDANALALAQIASHEATSRKSKQSAGTEQQRDKCLDKTISHLLAPRSGPLSKLHGNNAHDTASYLKAAIERDSCFLFGEDDNES